LVILASGLKYIGLDTQTLGWTLCVVLALAGLGHLVTRRPRRARRARRSLARGERADTEPAG
jgi:hypothetical protein